MGGSLVNIILFLASGFYTEELKEAVVILLLKKPTLDPTDPSNYLLVLNLSFHGKVIETAVAHFQIFLDDTSVLDPFHSCFHHVNGMEMVLVILIGNLCRQLY